ncbi:MAG: 6-phosphogluconate dehydrogenase (decarboxylating) [Candidatus Woykebacteria bacterium RBG_16_44_10]|uniref:6-phosphogluconate dehydrogenase (Decarboxylating) n=1 Tax=Candidatus Woykebacteria bacterium RBG_16_44_10 TaxID=1802597 RepID=A0A1G1WEG2_9BACT|nr:MAG: 6-phosphogluconate dehydrogenase (decarboxylating) [Candidatus Woykebacteria bacterium RBG_16_44_10]
MQVGIVGLGKMGFNFSLRLLEKGYQVVGFDNLSEPREQLAKQGGINTKSLEELCTKLASPRIVLLSVPHSAVEEILFAESGLVNYLDRGDIIIDAANAYYKNSIHYFQRLKKKGVDYLDMGVSGGPGGARNGSSIMVGGNETVYKKVEEVFADLAATDGYGYMGPAGAGHFVKMVHNGIEYVLMEAYGEGFELLASGPYKELDLAKIAKIWNHGGVVASFVLDKIEAVFAKDPRLETIEGFVEDLGEGRWVVREAIGAEIPVDTIAEALFDRFRSRQKDSFSAKLAAALRHEIGGHSIRAKK